MRGENLGLLNAVIGAAVALAEGALGPVGLTGCKAISFAVSRAVRGGRMERVR